MFCFGWSSSFGGVCTHISEADLLKIVSLGTLGRHLKFFVVENKAGVAWDGVA
jgi:hypothetical protein